MSPLRAWHALVMASAMVTSRGSAQPAPSPAPDAAAGSAVRACQEGGPCAIDDLKTPASPAFVLIGTTPESIVKPSSPAQLALAVYNGFGGGAVPAGFALEAAPYWLLTRSQLTYDEYRDADLGTQIVQNAGLSIGSAQSAPAADGSGRIALGVGLRTNVVIHSFHRSGKARRDEATQRAEENLFTLQQLHGAQRLFEANQCVEGDARAPCVSAAAQLHEARAKLHGLETSAEVSREAFDTSARELQTALDAREGIAIEVAGSAAWSSPAEHLSLEDFSRWGAWVTTGYESERWNLLGLGRYLAVDAGSVRFADVGLRGGWTEGRYGLHLEWLHRFVLDAPQEQRLEASNRFAATLEVRVLEGIYVSTTFGDDADSESAKGGVIALAGLSFQAGTKR